MKPAINPAEEHAIVDYRLARQATLHAWRAGELDRAQICDAQTELRRNAEFCGRAVEAPCPICDHPDLVEVTYVFGSRLPKHGRCITTAAELARLKARATPATGYVVEVCTRCQWNHLIRSEGFGGGAE